MTELYDTLKIELMDLKAEIKRGGVPKSKIPEMTDEEKLQGILMLDRMSTLYTHIYNFIHERKIGNPKDVDMWAEEHPQQLAKLVKNCCSIIGYWNPMKEE